MPEETGTVNKQFEQEIRKYERALQQGTPERKLRLSYPGEKAANYVCTNNECLNHVNPITTTYFLCAECSAIAPDTVRFLTHAPYKVLPSKKKRQQANAAAFAAWCRVRHANLKK